MSGEMHYAGLSATEIAEIERRRARVDRAIADDPVICDICGVTFRDYCDAMGRADFSHPAVVAHASAAPFNPPTLCCRQR